MKSRTKLWVIMLISAVGSLVLFMLLSLVFGKLLNAGYSLQKLNAISHETLSILKQKNVTSRDNIQPVLDEIRVQHPVLRLEWLASDGTIIYDTSGKWQRYDFTQLASRIVNMPNNLWENNEAVTLVYSLDQGGNTYYLIVSLPSDEMKAGQLFFMTRHFEVVYSMVFPLLLSILVPYFLSLWFFSSINRRIRKLNQAMGQFNLRSNCVVVEDRSKDEIAQLTRHYNSMAQRIQAQASEIEQLEYKRKLLLSNLSHDLRTPLTIILGYAETIRAGAYQDENELQTGAKVILQRSRYMDNLLDQLLDISRQEAVEFELHPALTSVSELMRKIVADYLLFLDEQGLIIEADIPEGEVEALIEAPLMERAIRNLLDNAIRYGSEGRFLGVSLIEAENHICISVMDRGKGIAPEEQTRIFDRFYRADAGRKGDGLGIGLSIVKEIVERHGGDIGVKSVPYEETLFLIKLPKADTGASQLKAV
ncbi:ATP-binding protein [Paenibacillus sp. GCM10027627]|uniref:sensor histidine kinase n=1 Tax=unclassified Paenibacillus TaxID=185978 RepID=UPI00362648C9